MLRVLLFVTALAAVYALVLFVVVRYVSARRRGKSAPLGKLAKGILAAGALGVLCMAYGRFIEPYWLDVRQISVSTTKLAPGTPPIRVLHVSDLQSDPQSRLEDRVADAARDLSPDVIVFTGDAVNSVEALPVFRACIERLAAVAPVYAVRGNWDIWNVPDAGQFDAPTKATVLDGRLVRVPVRGTALQLVGAPMSDEDGIADALRDADPRFPTVALFHPPHPEVVPHAHRGSTVDLMVAGHTHGGQVALPFFGALITFSRHGKRYESGLYDVDGMALHVSRGVGMEGGSAPRVRFWARPEITLIELRPATR